MEIPRTPERRPPASGAAAWKLLLVDDDQEVHDVTRLVLGDFHFQDRPLDIISAHSEAEARRVLATHDDIAVILLDVVMETDHSGLDLIEHIRNELDNHNVRIVLRTGQPGQAPEHDVIARYDINDYKEKTELTAQKLSTTMFAALRAWRDIMTIRDSKRGLERVMRASTEVFSHERQLDFRTAVLEQLTGLLDSRAVACIAADDGDGAPLRVIHATGPLREQVDRDLRQVLASRLLDSLDDARRTRRHQFDDDHYVLHFRDPLRGGAMLLLGQHAGLSELDRSLLELLATNIATALHNLSLSQDLSDAQMEMIYLLAGATESRSQETAAHVRRVGLLASLLARKHGLGDVTCERIRLAAPLHDLGKIGIPDAVLNKPGAHTPEEREVMRGHAEIGHRMLISSKRPVLQLAAEIAISHHERWDGTGYPGGLAGEQIPISGRVTMLADVFDALGSRRCYKDAWSPERIRAFIADNSSKMFDPALASILLEHMDQAEAIRAELPD